jgi:hypothetical protein
MAREKATLKIRRGAVEVNQLTKPEVIKMLVQPAKYLVQAHRAGISHEDAARLQYPSGKLREVAVEWQTVFAIRRIGKNHVHRGGFQIQRAEIVVLDLDIAL